VTAQKTLDRKQPVVIFPFERGMNPQNKTLTRRLIMALLRLDTFDPVSGLLALQSELDRALRSPNFNFGLSGPGAYPPINIFESEDRLLLVAEAPGLELDDLKISGAGRTLTISSVRKPLKMAGDAEGYHRRERAQGEFTRSMQLPDQFDLGRAEAKYERGMLIVRVPKREEAKPRQISVQNN
jgi:HSP20 family protein